LPFPAGLRAFAAIAGRFMELLARRAQVTVTPTSGQPVSGTLERIDDFNVSLRDASGEYQSFRRSAEVKVEVQDPYSAHNRMLDEYADADMHNIVAYLETLK
jgi:cytochrome c oxidase cbb3-type subunit III